MSYVSHGSECLRPVSRLTCARVKGSRMTYVFHPRNCCARERSQQTPVQGSLTARGTPLTGLAVFQLFPAFEGFVLFCFPRVSFYVFEGFSS